MSGWGLDAIITGPPEVVVHIGAGEAGPGKLAEQARSAVLVEPDPDRAEQLRVRYGGGPGVSIVEAAVAAQAGGAAFHRFSHPAMNSTRPPTGARELFRGLTRSDEAIVDCVTPADLVSETPLDGDGVNILIIDAASEVLLVLEALQEAGRLERFDQIIARVSEVALHEGGADRAAVQDWARAQGRMMLAVPGQSDPDLWRAWIGPARGGQASASPADAERVNALERALESARVAADAAQQRQQEIRERMASDLQAAQSRATALERELAEAVAAREAAQDRLHRASEQIAQLEAMAARAHDNALKMFREEQAEERTRSEQLRQDLDSQRQKAQARSLELERAVEEYDVRARELEARVKALETAMRESEEREAALKAETGAARENLRLALTGQRLAQASLAELQARHAELVEDRNALDALLRQVTDRLSNAAGYAAAARLTETHPGSAGEW